MRLHTLVLTGVGPFLARQEIDFDDLAGSGLFLIDGATGTGKSTIIDAIVYALFGGVSGGTDSDSRRMRSHYCSDTDPTGVTLEFTVDGRRHRISRVPTGARDPQEPTKAATSKPERQVLTEFAADGSEKTVLVRDNAVRRHVESLLDMNANQFRQLVVLPQGKFAELLRMTPTERLTALASLLDHHEFFSRVQEDLKSQGVKAEDDRRAARAAVLAAAQQLAGRLRSHLDARETPPDIDFTSPDASDDDRIATVDTLLARLADEATAAVKEREDRRVVAEAAHDAAGAARGVADALAAVGDAQEAVSRAAALLEAADADITEAAIVARIGELNVQEGALGEHAAWEAQSRDRAREVAELASQEEQCRARAAALHAEKAAIPGRRREREQERAGLQKVAATLPAAVAEETRLADLVGQADQLLIQVDRLATLTGALNAAEARESEAAAFATDAQGAWVGLMDQQRLDQAARLAEALAPGDECPVCGSTAHPRPAHAADGRLLVTDAVIASARKVATAADTAATEASSAVTSARSQWLACTSEVAARQGALGGATPDAVRALHAAAMTSRDDAAAAELALPEIESELELLMAAETTLDGQISELTTRANQLRGAITEREAAEQRGLEHIRTAIGEAESATVLLATTRTRRDALAVLQQAHAALAAAAMSVPADRRTLALPDARALALTAEEASTSADAALAAAADTASTLSTAVSEATPMATAFTKSLRDRRVVDAQTSTAYALAQLASGKNARSLPLRSYALQRRFASVLAAASVHLERMSSGKFSFELSEEAGKGQAGLGIALHDAWTGHKQDPKSLSGGETFYAALSLALGLADIVRGEAGGSALETLFIDEGFGSLDQETLYQVLDQLDQMRSGGRVVGVISHVTEMKESIPDRIEVRRQADSTSTVSRPTDSSS